MKTLEAIDRMEKRIQGFLEEEQDLLSDAILKKKECSEFAHRARIGCYKGQLRDLNSLREWLQIDIDDIQNNGASFISEVKEEEL